MTGGNETLVIKDYVNGTFGITLENAAPVASNDSVSTVKNINTVIDVLANDTDADGTLNPSTVAIVDGPDHGSVTIDTSTAIDSADFAHSLSPASRASSSPHIRV
jgi:hypothetical protein